MDANERRARATGEATQWWTRLGTKAPADVSETDREEFTQWLRESPLHVAELLQVAHVHDVLERFELWDEIPLEAQSEDNNVIALPSQHQVAAEAPEGKNLGPRRHGVKFLLAASVCCLAIAAGWLLLRSGATTIETDRAERREVVLNDGSVVNLEPETLLRVNLGKHQRYIDLARGRALFHVAKDPTRPFIVHAGDTEVRAVGTIFGVEQKDENVIVTVSEGKVGVVPGSQLQTAVARSNSGPPEPSTSGQDPHPRAISAHAQRREGSPAEPSGLDAGRPGEVFLTADQQIVVRKSGDASAVQNVDSGRALAWSEGRLVFDSTPLADVVDEFNRYNRLQLHISGPQLARRTVSGVFRASDPETLIDFIGAGAHVVVTRKGPEEIVISPGP